MAWPSATAACLMIGVVLLSKPLAAQVGPLSNTADTIPDGWTGMKFEMSADYPTSLPPMEAYPWLSFEFKSQPQEYIEAVLDYVLEGNREVDWKVQDNAIRKWYHAPGFAGGSSGREFVRGLTRERTSQAGELHAGQTTEFQNWAVGFYNPRGGFTLGEVWKDPESPNPAASLFPEGTVAAKLLFSEANEAEVPYVEDAPEWEVNIQRNQHLPSPPPIPSLRLLQVDVAVRDSRADDLTGWVFGTFVYQHDPAVTDPWERLQPVGLMWGNDPDLTPDKFAAGEQPTESWINPDVSLPHVGWLGRLNGPVDNPISSCLSCHSTAGWKNTRMTFRATDSEAVKMQYFRNIKAGQPFRPEQQSLDYSLQLAIGIRNYPGTLEDATPPAGPAIAAAEARAEPDSFREGDADLSELDSIPLLPEESPAPTAVNPIPPPAPSAFAPDSPLRIPPPMPKVADGFNWWWIAIPIALALVVLLFLRKR